MSKIRLLPFQKHRLAVLHGGSSEAPDTLQNAMKYPCKKPKHQKADADNNPFSPPLP